LLDVKALEKETRDWTDTEAVVQRYLTAIQALHGFPFMNIMEIYLDNAAKNIGNRDPVLADMLLNRYSQ
jgi:hypothetical protein